MLKRIDRQQLRVGMFIEAFEGAAVDARFADRRFLLDKPADLKNLKTTTSGTVIINTARGSDVPGGDGVVLATEGSHAKTKRDVAILTKTLTKAGGLVRDVFETLRNGGAISVETVAPIVNQITEAMEHNPVIVINLTRLKTKDEATFIHSLAVCALMIRFARYMNFNAEMIRVLGMGGLLHDVGKTGIPADILMKPDALAGEEMTLMKSHPAIGYDILSRQDGIPAIVLDICLNHHERPNGSGYPAGLSGDQISVYTRMCSICDVYDALTSARPYKKPWTAMQAAAWMLEKQGFFDRDLLNQFLKGVMKL
ncbi:HD-GYP domain-containing protein [Pararhizobium sp.]|uniref:HD-GYP domain-containing protein n=1 Tax=Pararhizobium sp. TaxID=1977563 RepID=UPI002715BB67|nr:HD-GYP domain-containing protein [Pararhizobium sp.]MDO9415574.1 HD-GYP domain-containing protein [Pararhizobium sp.]